MKRSKFYQEIMRELKENRSTFIVYTSLRIIVLVIMILQIFNKNFEHVFLCLLTLFLMILPSIVQVTLKVEFPSVLEIIVLCFIFAAEILGEMSSFYIYFPYWDTVLHTLSGFLLAAIGLSLVDIMNETEKIQVKLSPLYLSIVAFCFSMTIGVLWEFFEFGMDNFFGLDMQKDTVIHTIRSVALDPTKSNTVVTIDNINEVIINGEELGMGGYLDIGLYDTMEDLFVNFVGAFAFSFFGYFYTKYRKKNVFKQIMPTPQKKGKYDDLHDIPRKPRKVKKRKGGNSNGKRDSGTDGDYKGEQ